jgi:hypothetical protein
MPTFLYAASLLLASLSLLTFLVQPSTGALVEHSGSLGVGRIGTHSHIAAQGDLNSDKHTDLFVINAVNASRKQWTVEVWMWNVESSQCGKEAP